MTATAIVFTGPTIDAVDVGQYLVAEVRHPVAQGDVYRAARDGTRAIGIVDGYFEQVPAVWHKEILWAMSQGIRVYGSASMGALRAAELEEDGMIGVGEIFRAFQSGALEDDEVAVAHGPPERGYRPVSEAMVNVRATLVLAQEQGLLCESTTSTLLAVAKATFYAERTYAGVLAAGLERGLPTDELARFRHWARRNAVNQKRADAVAMLRRMSADLAERSSPKETFPHFEPTDAWEAAVKEMEARSTPRVAAAQDQIDDMYAQATVAALLNEEIQLFAPYALTRALRKQQNVARSSRSDTQGQQIREALAWYFERRLGRTIPQDLEGYAHEIGMPNAAAMQNAIVREHAYVNEDGR